MQLLRIIREESGIFSKYESAIAKATKEEIVSPVSQGRNILHFLCS
jgi:hypothetical protein